MADAGADAEDVLNVTKLEVGPDGVAVSAALNITIEYTVKRDLANAWWEFSYTVDSARQRNVIALGTFPAEGAGANLEAGKPQRAVLQVDGVDVSMVKPSRLANVGMLSATLRSGPRSEEAASLAAINVVVEVARTPGADKKDPEAYLRTIYNPLADE